MMLHRTLSVEEEQLLHLLENHFFHLKMGLGRGINNYAKLLFLKFLLLFAKEKDLHHLQLFGDSMNVINWTNKNNFVITFYYIQFWRKFTDFWTPLTLWLSHMYTWTKTWQQTLCKKEILQLLQGQWHIKKRGRHKCLLPQAFHRWTRIFTFLNTQNKDSTHHSYLRLADSLSSFSLSTR